MSDKIKSHILFSVVCLQKFFMKRWNMAAKETKYHKI